MNPRRTLAAVLAAATLAVLVPGTASAHGGALAGLSRGAVSLSRSTWRLEKSSLTGELIFVRHQVAHVATGAPATASGVNEDVDDAALEGAVTGRVDVERGGRACPGTVLPPPEKASAGAFAVRVRWDCPGGDEPVRVRLGFLADFESAHRHLASVDDGRGSRTDVLNAGSPVLELAPGAASWVPWGFFALGVHHIVLGYDHLVFLFGLLLLGGGWRSMLATVTSFTLAHSVTLALAALEVWNPGPSFVEPAIGATIAYVGVENLFLKEPRGRWRITFLLGLVHGFGFAAALADAGLAKAHVVSALLLFNLGVEAGQVAVLAVVLPLVLLARRRPWVVSRAVPAASVAVALFGLVLLLTRVAGGGEG